MRRIPRRVVSGLLSLTMLLGVLLLCLPACSTLLVTPSGDKYLMGGTRENIRALGPRRENTTEIMIPPFFAFLDFPCSLALDLLLSPITLPLQLIKGDKDYHTSNPAPEEGDGKKPP
jgi:uncharacterized protein YceK